MFKMEYSTSNKEITERNSKILHSLESELNAAEKAYSSDMDFIKELKDPELKKYASSKESALNDIKSAFEKDNLSILSLLNKKLAGEKDQYEKSIREFDNDKDKANLKYNSSVCESVLKYFYQSSPLVEKRINDASEFVDSHEVIPKEYEEAKEALNQINSHMRKAMNKGKFWGRKFSEGEKEAKTIVKEFETKKAEKEAGERYPLIIPIWLGMNSCNNDHYDVEILSPINKNSSIKAKIEDIILDESIGYDDNLNDTDKDLVGCKINIHKDKINDLKTALEKNISESLRNFNIKPKIYETHLKSTQSKCMSIVRVEQSYSLDEVSKMKNIKKATLYAMAGGYGQYKNHPIRQYCFRELGNKGKQIYKIKEPGISLLDKQNHELPADKKVVSVKEANKRLGYALNSTACYIYLKNGAFESVKSGSHVYITENSLDKFISTHKKSEKSGRWFALVRNPLRVGRKKRSLSKYA